MTVAGLHLRLARPGDLAAVDALFAHSYARLIRADYPPSVLVTAVPLLARAQPALLASGRYWLAEAEEGILGAGGWSPRGATDGEIRHLVTRASHVRQGIASALLGRAIAQASAEGILRLHCLATRTAVPFYERMGFRRLGEVSVPLGPGVTFPSERMLRAP
ncbi:GNAT family N-acetyltransferase [Cereibacter johrii]|uniref:GNAT family acetyltransferase n=1 Tax=Cereibacter johrii TaxID=445629 RepID=A0ABX5JDZ1_9RHOB|nr:GNAT family N-acetyltransferase [Cereibacter johrii]ODM44015.1 acetyltransferase [Cereibacter johrii]PTM81309.1 GNAT family acetyltransferase [Cereibacter johrii]